MLIIWGPWSHCLIATMFPLFRSFLSVFYFLLEFQSCPERSWSPLSLSLSFSQFDFVSLSHRHIHASLLILFQNLHVFSTITIWIIKSTFATQDEVYGPATPSSPGKLLDMHNLRTSHPPHTKLIRIPPPLNESESAL